MRKSSLLLKLLLLIMFYSCTDEAFVTRNESVHKKDIMNYFDRLKEVSDEKTAGLIDKTIASLDFSNISEMKLADNETFYIVDVEKLKELESEGVIKALFFVNNNEIVRSNLITFSNTTKDYNALILAVLTGQFDNSSYSGKVSMYSVSHDINFFFRIEDNELKESGTLNRKPKMLEGGKTNGCIDWYLVTTYYYSNGNKRTEDQYLFTTCNTECNDTRISGRITCGGGGGAVPYSGAPVFPTNPINGDRYRWMRTNGEKIDYIWVAPLGSWIKYLITTPEATVQNEPYNYPDLLTDGPIHQQIILTGADFLYEYNAYTGSWVGVPNFTVDGNDPFAKAIANVHNYVKCFNKGNHATVSVLVTQPLNRSNLCEFHMTNVGHTFLSINQGDYTRTVGFYPSNRTYPGHPSEPSQLKDNSGKAWDVSVTFDVSADELAKLLNYIENETPGTYHLNDFNCTDWVVAAFAKMNINLPQNEVWFPGGMGLCPGQFGEDMRELNIPGRSYTVSPSWQTGNAPTNKGDCN